MIFGIHPCDMHALSVLDRVFMSDFVDSYYKKARSEIITVVLNCTKACEHGFCASMGTGPFLRIREGYDIEITPLTHAPDNSQVFLLEPGSPRGNALIERVIKKRPAGKRSREMKIQKEAEARAALTRTLDTQGLPELLAHTLEHPVYKRVAEERCLGCTNCTMVCPTCYCYTLEDDTSFDLRATVRKRRWDSCQELNFAGVHGGNFRASREARLRQFITHKLGTWVRQYHCFGCVGCGRCIRWCPTGIDLVEIVTHIQEG
jgi:sulfhydrogenase subunit beta (sulfur reductase)